MSQDNSEVVQYAKKVYWCFLESEERVGWSYTEIAEDLDGRG